MLPGIKYEYPINDQLIIFLILFIYEGTQLEQRSHQLKVEEQHLCLENVMDIHYTI